MSETATESRWVRWVVAAAAGLTAGVSLFLAWTLHLWVDEAYTINTTGGGLVRACFGQRRVS